jgi:Ni/Co efflux regulator RcnB
MNRFFATALAAAMLAAPSLAFARDMQDGDGRDEPRHEQQAPQRQHQPQASRDDHRQPDRDQRRSAAPQQHVQSRAWNQGDRFDRHYAPHYARVVYVERYGLAPPPPDQVWVRSGFDALLVRLSNNVVVAISPGVFR